MISPAAVVACTVETDVEDVGVDAPEVIPGSALRLLSIVGNWRGFADLEVDDLEGSDGGKVNTPWT